MINSPFIIALTRQDIPQVVVGYGGRETGVVKNGKNWTMLARANGFPENQVGEVVHPDPLVRELRKTIETPGPGFLELRTPYEECLPLMPPGKSFEDIIL